MSENKKGFTLIELLVVIAIIALLVSVIIPTVKSAAIKARAAADAANLRSTLAEVNTRLVDASSIDDVLSVMNAPDSKSIPGAVLQIYYEDPAGMEAYYVDGENYYGVSYLADVAENGESRLATAAPAGSGAWYQAGTGNIG